MKRTFLLLALNAAVFTLFAQQTVISNAEDTGTGWWPAGSACCIDLWDTPAKDSENNTSKAVTVWINNDNVNYTGGGISGLNVDVSLYNTISVMVYKQITGKVRLELQDGVGPNQFVTQEYTAAGVWQKLNFPIPAGMGNIKTLLVAPHFEDYTLNPIPDGESHRMWWDEVIAFNDASTGVTDINANTVQIIRTELYTITGEFVKSFDKDASIIDYQLKPGLYLVKKINEKGVVKCSKIALN